MPGLEHLNSIFDNIEKMEQTDVTTMLKEFQLVEDSDQGLVVENPPHINIDELEIESEDNA